VPVRTQPIGASTPSHSPLRNTRSPIRIAQLLATHGEEGVRVTLALSRRSADFFNSEAARHHTQYQRMIRKWLDGYVDAHGARDRPKRARG
jgi:hypothetical protein